MVKTHQQAANDYYLLRFDQEQKDLIARAWHSATEEDEQALEELQAQPLSIEKISRDYRNDYITWEILIGTGGPADRVLVNARPDGEILGVDYEYQDWGTPWTPAENQDKELVTKYAELIGYYEVPEAE